MEDIGNIVVLVFFLLVGVVSTLAKALSDHIARNREKDAARKVAEKIRRVKEASGRDHGGPDAVFAPGSGPEKGAGRGQREETVPAVGQAPQFFDDEPDETPREPLAMVDEGMPVMQAPAGESLFGAASLPLEQFKAGGSENPRRDAPAGASRPSPRKRTGFVFRVRKLDRPSLREAFVLSEVLAPPLALRPGGGAPDR